MGFLLEKGRVFEIFILLIYFILHQITLVNIFVFVDGLVLHSVVGIQ